MAFTISCMVCGSFRGLTFGRSLTSILFLAEQCLERHVDHTNVVLPLKQRRDRTVKEQHPVDGDHRRVDRGFHGEHHITLQLHELADEREVPVARWNDLRAVFQLTGHELAGDIGHDHGDCCDMGHDLVDLVLQTSVIQELPHDLFAGALGHGLFHTDAAVICVQAVEPHELDVLRLVRGHGLERHIVR